MNITGFRKAALERLSAPEQIDEIVRVTAAREWIALGAIVLVLSAIVVWAFEGALPAKATGKGVIVRTGGVLNVVTLSGGLVLSVSVKVGDRVSPNQVIARVAQPGLVEKIKAARLQLEQARQGREFAARTARGSATLQTEALQVQRENVLREISDLEAQSQLAAEQVPVEDHLLAKGLVTKQQTIAARQKLTALQQQIAGRRALLKQYDAQRFSIESQPEQSDTERLAQIRYIEMTIASLNKELSLAENVTSSYSGEVIEMKVDAGSVVQPEAPILSIQSEGKRLEAVVCIPSIYAKNVDVEMMAEISPSTVKREEFGFIRGKVSYVAEYPATSAALMRYFQNESLVKALSSEGPVTEIRVAMVSDSDAPSGFQWSSSKGPPRAVSSGTICSVEIVTSEQKPIALVIPYFRKKLGVS